MSSQSPELTTIRSIAKSDFEAWKALWDGYNAFYGRHGATALPDGTTRMTWARFHDPQEPVHALVAEESGRIGLIYLLQLIALISLNLTVVNLIPFPALDGGRFFMILIEKIKGSPISRKTEAAVNTIGFAFLILLMLLLTIRDVSQWF